MKAPQIPCLSVADIELPRSVVRLYDLAYNFWWSWTPRARRLFNMVDPIAWSAYRNPVQMLINVEPTHWEQLLQSEPFLSTYSSVVQQFDEYMNPERKLWFHRNVEKHEDGPIAYFSTEYGLHESFNIYSGGLGILSGDHCKSASDLGLPFVAVGLLYKRGYFRQAVDADGRQQHMYPRYDFSRLSVRPIAGPTGREVIVQVELPNRVLHVKLWLAQVGRVPLILLDTDVSLNDPADRPITSTLYVRGREMRLVQEMVLGIGGVKALRALDIHPGTWHLNEGHSAFLQLERLRELIQDRNSSYGPELIEHLRKKSVFTTHTPVEAGHERFDEVLVRKYFHHWTGAGGMSIEQILELGQSEEDSSGDYNLTVLAMKTSGKLNGVSELHAQVSNRMWQRLLSEEGRENSIRAITNGIHTFTWLGLDMLELFNRHLGSGWGESLLNGEGWEKVQDIPDDQFWAAHMAQKERLSRFVRVSLREQFARHGRSPDELRDVEELCRVEPITIGFARRFATYKRANLIFSDLHRLKKLLSDSQWPVQILIAGKAHPADLPGQELIQHLFQLTQSGVLRGKIFFLEDYDMRVGRMMVQGVDVWLNTPRRPMEASGTSGQKAAANGCLNLSVLDGWWPEAYDPSLGWAIGSSESHADEEIHDRQDAISLYDLLEEKVVPLYYRTDETGLPRDWIRMMKNCIQVLTPRFSTSRMVRDYARLAYFADENPLFGAGPDPSEVIRLTEGG